MSSNSVAPPTSNRRLGWTGLVGAVVTVLLLWWALHDVSFAEVARHLADANHWWLALAVVTVTLTFPLRTVRWRYLLRLEGQTLPFRPLWHATAIGFMANNILPARGGEFARAYAASRLTGTRFATAFASLAVERILDGIMIVTLLVVAIATSDFEGATVGGIAIERVALVAGAAFAGLLVVAIAVVRWPGPMLHVAERMLTRITPQRVARRLIDLMEGLIGGLEALRTVRDLLVVSFWSAVVWLVNAASFWVAFHAFGIEASWSAALLLQGIIALGVAIPSSPGFFGVFEGAARASLALYGVQAGQAVSYAIGYHVAGFVPITILGFVSLYRAGLRLRELRRSASTATGAEAEAGTPNPA